MAKTQSVEFAQRQKYFFVIRKSAVRKLARHPFSAVFHIIMYRLNKNNANYPSAVRIDFDCGHQRFRGFSQEKPRFLTQKYGFSLPFSICPQICPYFFDGFIRYNTKNGKTAVANSQPLSICPFLISFSLSLTADNMNTSFRIFCLPRHSQRVIRTAAVDGPMLVIV